ncbi:MAG: PilZ domain-containing protein [Candidatus Omnitrophota bacterium]|nr:PilZ domain-containing protein [Candidatus Omnitrophota bacterium]
MIGGNLSFQDRRLFERIEAKYPLRLTTKVEPFKADIYLRNFSASGVKVITKQKLSIDKEIDFWIEVPDGYKPIHFQGKVVWLRDEGKNVWDAGISFKNVNLMDCHRLLNRNPVIKTEDILT